MKKSLVATFFILIIFSLSLLMFGSQSVFAATPPHGIASLAGCSGTDCSACNVVYMANGGINWLIGITFIIFAVIMVIAGIGLVTSGGNQSALDAAKSKFTNAIIGLIIILSAWLIVDTIMRGLVGNEGKLDNGGEMSGWLFWSQVECQTQTKDTGRVEIGLIDFELSAEELQSGAYITDMNVGADGMVTIPGTSQKATPDTARRFVAMRAAAAAAGITLTVTEGWRSDATQLRYWNNHGCNVNPSLCSGTVARPISLGGNGSNHNRGVALDLNTPYGSAAFNWIKQNGGQYGFYNNLGARDPWHWSPSGR